MRPTVAEISIPRLLANYRAIRSEVGESVAVMAVVKANAYGHGAEEVSRALAAEGAAWFGVCSVEEASPLRRAGITQPILVLSGFWPGQQEQVYAERLVPAIFDEEQLALLEAEGRRRSTVLVFHLKVDSGMGRLGVDPAALPAFLKRLRACRHVCLDGLLTHFASADAPSPDQTLSQLAVFERIGAELAQAGFPPRWVHAAATTALVRFPASRGNLVRPGIGLYGYSPGVTNLPVSAVLVLKSRIMSVREVPPGTPLGYGASYVTPGPARIACVPAGYADGINRLLSNRGKALVRGRHAPIVGRVNMDLTLLDVSQVPGAAPGDEAVLIGRQGQAEVTAEDVAAWAQTIPYEILCNISPRVPRVYLRD
jgi:alanine racemase